MIAARAVQDNVWGTDCVLISIVCCRQALGARSWKSAVLALLAANTAVAMKQADGFLSLNETDIYYSSFPGRINTTVAGKTPPPRCATVATEVSDN